MNVRAHSRGEKINECAKVCVCVCARFSPHRTPRTQAVSPPPPACDYYYSHCTGKSGDYYFSFHKGAIEARFCCSVFPAAYYWRPPPRALCFTPQHHQYSERFTKRVHCIGNSVKGQRQCPKMVNPRKLSS